MNALLKLTRNVLVVTSIFFLWWLANHYIFIIPMRGGLCNTTFIGIPCSSDWWMSELLIVIEIGIGLILAMAGTWLLHLRTLLDPILLFDYNWSLIQILGVMVLTSILVTSAAHLVTLTHRGVGSGVQAV